MFKKVRKSNGTPGLKMKGNPIVSLEFLTSLNRGQ